MSLNNKRILVTGACGTIGSSLIKHLKDAFKNAEILGIDNNEANLFFLDQEFINDSNIFIELIDMRDKSSLSNATKGVDVIFHTAALKHVVLCERSPFEAVQTNILGINNLIECAIQNNVKKVIFTSSDKAVNPTSVMGTSKLMGEKMIAASNNRFANSSSIFTSTRFGNVLGSSGSVIPIFMKQIQKGGPLTLTHNDMTRFVMTIDQAVDLVIESSEIAKGGEVLITKMPVINIKDLAEVMIDIMSNKPLDINIIGTKPGEKLYEELMSDEEVRRSIELQKYFSVLPAFRGMYQNIAYDYRDTIKESVDKPYNSSTENKMTKNELKDYLIKNKILENLPGSNDPDRRYWPGDK